MYHMSVFPQSVQPELRQPITVLAESNVAGGTLPKKVAGVGLPREQMAQPSVSILARY